MTKSTMSDGLHQMFGFVKPEDRERWRREAAPISPEAAAEKQKLLKIIMESGSENARRLAKEKSQAAAIQDQRERPRTITETKTTVTRVREEEDLSR